MIYEDGKGTVTSSVESLMLDHFSQIASVYSQYRTFDHEAINYIIKKLAFKNTIVAADIGCGDGRYSIKLIEKLRNRLSLTCVDNNYELSSNGIFSAKACLVCKFWKLDDILEICCNIS